MNRALWMSGMVVVVIVTLGFNSNALAQSPGPSASVPLMTDELMSRLIKRTLAAKKDRKIDKRVAGIFGLNDGSVDLPAKQITYSLPEGKHTILVCTKVGSSDIFFGLVHGDSTDIYLTDTTGKLLAAAIWDFNGLRIITNAQAAEKFKAELALFAKEAAELPPTGTAPLGSN